MNSRSTRIGLLLLTLAALGLRLGVVALLAANARETYTYEHGEIARNLLAGNGFTIRFLGATGPTSQQGPFYPALLAACYWLTGNEPRGVLLIEILQAFAGAAIVPLVVSLTWSLLPGERRAGWLAGVAAALFPPHLYMVVHVQVAVWGALVLTALVVAALGGRASSGSHRWSRYGGRGWLVGALAGWLVLIDPILGLALPVVALAWLAAPQRSRWPAIAAAWLMLAVLVLPWTLRNRAVHGEWIFVKSTFGYAFWQGNNPLSLGTDKLPVAPLAATGKSQVYPEANSAQHADKKSGLDLAAIDLAAIDRRLGTARVATRYIDGAVLGHWGILRLRGLNEPARSRLLGAEAWQYVCREPGAYFERCLRRLRYFWLWDETNPKAAHPVYRVATVLWLALLIAGLAAGRRAIGSWWPVAAVIAAVMAFHMLVIVSARFRMPIEPVSLMWVGLALARIVDWFSRWVRPSSSTEQTSPRVLFRRVIAVHAAAGRVSPPHRAAEVDDPARGPGQSDRQPSGQPADQPLDRRPLPIAPTSAGVAWSPPPSALLPEYTPHDRS